MRSWASRRTMLHDGQHGVGVYVQGHRRAPRDRVGAAATGGIVSERAGSATSLQLDSSLAAVDFYRANGFVETGRGEHRLRSGRTMACVFMRKNLSGVGVQ